MSPSSPPPRASLLPKELDDIDAAWGEEPPTVVYPSAPPPPLPEAHEDVSDRVTAIPAEPGDEFARRLMAAHLADSTDVLSPTGTPASFAGDSGHRRHTPEIFALNLDEVHPGGLAPASPFALETQESWAMSLPPEPEERPEPLGLLFELEGDRSSDRPTWEGTLLTLPPTPGPLNPSGYPTAPPPRGFGVDRFDWEMTPPGSDSRRPGPSASAPVVSEQTLRPPELAFSRELPEYGSSGPNIEPMSEMKDRFAMGDFSGALELAEQTLALEPHHGETLALAQKCREVLLDMYMSRLQNLASPPRVVMKPDELRWLSLDHRAGFLLSMVDGHSTFDEVLDVSGMPRLDAMRILCELLEKNVIAAG